MHKPKLETLETFGGNTITPKVRTVPGKRWCFTLNNYTLEEMETLETLFRSNGNFIFGKEVGEQGTPHLQGYVEFDKKVRPIEFVGNKRISWRKSKGTKEQNITYCSKENNFITNFILPEKLKDPLANIELYNWQKDILNIIKTEPDSRKIYWFYDSKGNIGKTSLAKHICINNKNCIFLGGKAGDIKSAIADMPIKPKICIFGFPRSLENFVSYQALEEVKDGIFFSGKYESSMCLFNPPHVICFANFAPDKDKLSMDRWVIKNLNGLT